MESRMKNMINLLPPSYRRQQLIRKRVLQWSAVISGVLVLGWALHWYESREYQALTQRLEVLRREHRPTQNMLRQLVQMRQTLVDLEQQEAVASELEGQRTALALLGAISQAAQKTNERLRVTNLELSSFQSLHDAEAPDTPIQEPSGLVLTGVSLDYPAVTEFVDGLQSSGIFSLVELTSMKERAGNDASLHDYEVRCEF
jgi:Tfp pilus assembly protein PilN